MRVVLDVRADAGPIRAFVSVPASTDEVERSGRMVRGWMELAHVLESVRCRSRPREERPDPEDAEATAMPLQRNSQTAPPTGG